MLGAAHVVATVEVTNVLGGGIGTETAELEGEMAGLEEESVLEGKGRLCEVQNVLGGGGPTGSESVEMGGESVETRESVETAGESVETTGESVETTGESVSEGKDGLGEVKDVLGGGPGMPDNIGRSGRGDPSTKGRTARRRDDFILSMVELQLKTLDSC